MSSTEYGKAGHCILHEITGDCTKDITYKSRTACPSTSAHRMHTQFVGTVAWSSCSGLTGDMLSTGTCVFSDLRNIAGGCTRRNTCMSRTACPGTSAHRVHTHSVGTGAQAGCCGLTGDVLGIVTCNFIHNAVPCLVILSAGDIHHKGWACPSRHLCPAHELLLILDVHGTSHT